MTTRKLIRSCIPFLILLISNGFFALLGIAAKLRMPELSEDYIDLFVSYGYVICLVVILYFFYIRKGFASFTFHAKKRSYLSATFLSICIFFAVSGILGVLSEFFPEAFATYIYSLNNMALAKSPFLWIYSVLLAPFAEELCFRGLCLTNLSKDYLFPTANVIQAFLFAIIHASLIQVGYAFVLGLILGYIYKKFAGLGPTFLFHAVFNACNLPLVFFLSDVGSPMQRYNFFMVAGILPLLIYLLEVHFRAGNSSAS